MTQLELAQQYASLGLPVFPVIPKSKAPATKEGFKSATLDKEQINKWWGAREYSIGCAIPEDVIVVDFDALSHEHISDMDETPLPSTWVARTPGKGGGRHYWYKIPEGFGRIAPKVKVIEGIDIRTYGSYVVMPCSVHPEGGHYIWEEEPTGSLADLPDCPGWIIEACLTPHPHAEKGGVDLAEYMRGIPPGARQIGLFRVACYLRSKDLDPVSATAVVEELARRSEGAGYKKWPDIPALIKRVWDRYEAGNQRTLYKIWTLDELMSADLGQVEWFVKDLLGPGLALIYADEKQGKSMMAANMALSISTREKLWDWFVVPKARGVLYLDLEQNVAFGRQRWKKILDGRQAPQNLRVVFNWERMDHGGLDDLKEVLQSNPDIEVVVFDIWSEFIPLSSQPGSNAYHMEVELLKKLKKVANEYRCLFVLVHHTNKDGDASGTRAMKSSPDYLFDLHRDPRSTVGEVEVKGKNIEACKLLFNVNLEKFHWSVTGVE